jgi:AbiV family abortive infection protein
MDENARENFDELVRGAQLAFDNAEALYNEAQLLGANGAFARALTLHQISLEECSKLDILCVAATSMVMGHPVDLDKLAGKFRQHKVKNYNNAYMSSRTEAEVEASKRGDGAAAIEIFKAHQANIHRILNTNKNASLYVDYDGGRFVAPSEKISEEMAAQLQQVNAMFMRHGSSSLGVLRKMAEDPDTFAAQAASFTSLVEQVKDAEGDLEEKFQGIVTAWLESEVAKARSVSEHPSSPKTPPVSLDSTGTDSA